MAGVVSICQATYQTYIDWQNTGIINPNDSIARGLYQDSTLIQNDVSTLQRSVPTEKIVRGVDQVRPLATISAGTDDFELDNISRTYSTYNGSSPLTGILSAGVIVQQHATFLGIDYCLSTTILQDIGQNPEINQQSVSLPCLGLIWKMRVLRNQFIPNLVSSSQAQPTGVSTALYQNITTDVALGHLLDAIGFPASMRQFSTGNTTLDWWWLDSEDPLSAAQQILNSEGPGARLYEDTYGNIVFENRYYRLTTTRSTTSQATFTPTGPEPLHLPPFKLGDPTKDIVNTCSVTAKTRSAKTLAAVWTWGSQSFAPNQAISFVVHASDPYTAAVVPVAATDYTLVTGSIASATLSRTSGSNAILTMTAGASGASITGLQVRAQSVTVDSTLAVSNTVDASASIKLFGQRPYPLQVRAEINANVLQGFCDGIVGWYKTPRDQVTMTVHANRSPTCMVQVLSRLPSDRITVQENNTGVNTDFYIERIQHDKNGGGMEHMGSFGLEKANSAAYFTLDSASAGTLDGPGILAF